MNDPVIPPWAKRCTGPDCGQVKPLAAFNRHAGTRDGREDRCRDCRSAAKRARRAADRAAVLAHYGQVCACPGCGATDDLTIDHVNGGGEAHRAALGVRSSGFYAWLIGKGFPPGYQTLCAPCNQSKHDGRASRLDHSAPPGWRRCTGPDCGRVLPLAAFSQHPRGREGRDSRCRDCRATEQAARRDTGMTDAEREELLRLAAELHARND